MYFIPLLWQTNKRLMEEQTATDFTKAHSRTRRHKRDALRKRIKVVQRLCLILGGLSLLVVPVNVVLAALAPMEARRTVWINLTIWYLVATLVFLVLYLVLGWWKKALHL